MLLLDWKGAGLAIGRRRSCARGTVDRPARQGLRRSRAFEQQLPEILDTLAASLRAGHGFDHGLQTVATDVGEPAGREFRRVIAEVHLGRSLEDALAELGRRIRSADLQFVLDAIAIQRQVGGSLAELFVLVATTVRAREQFRRNLRAITGQVRISANVLTFLPLVAALLLTLVNPSYMSPLWHTSSGHILTLVVSGNGSLRLLRPSARRKGAVVTVLLLVLAALTLSASIFLASEVVTASGRRRHSAVAVVRQWSAASGELRGDTSRAKRRQHDPEARPAADFGEVVRRPASAARCGRPRGPRHPAGLCRVSASARRRRRCCGTAAWRQSPASRSEPRFSSRASSASLASSFRVFCSVAARRRAAGDQQRPP